MALNTIDWHPNTYRIGGKPEFLVSGEFHYFRVPRQNWEPRLRLLQEAGCNCVATYIPWILHELVEGDIRFGDKPERDLDGFLALCLDLGIYVIGRPGPYQYSELKFCGLLGWLSRDYPQILAQNIRGEVMVMDSVSYLHPVFLEKTKKWFDAVCPILARHTLNHGGAVAFVQIDNELTGIHEWFGVQWRFGKTGHLRILEFLLEQLDCEKLVVFGDNPNLWTVIRTDGSKRMLFVMNLFSAPMKGNIRIKMKDGSYRDMGAYSLNPMEVRALAIEERGVPDESDL